MSDGYRAGLTAAIAILVGALANVLYAPEPGMAKVAAWVATMAMVVVLCACIGKAIAHQWTGVLIDSRNRISLSRLQMFGWTLVVLSGLITAVASNLALSNNVLALSINIPDPLLIAMGIAATSAAATPALLTLKTDAAGASLVPSNTRASHASWLDMFQGDE
ncbi:MAG TPA: hypothetical protein VJS15_07280, partial [Allosphingosinicella sp.]|nr:hypothetical protein [Allosphingosinicella sp.]